jgi:DNA-binding transcriptional MocR family regulator
MVRAMKLFREVAADVEKMIRGKVLGSGDKLSHLQKLRRQLALQQHAALQALQRHLPAGFRVAAPRGGYFLWIECAPGVDSLDVHRRALEFGITVAPGPIFSARRQFQHFLRINTGHPWSNAMESAIARLGDILRRY